MQLISLKHIDGNWLNTLPVVHKWAYDYRRFCKSEFLNRV